jgi:RNA polymerase I-specific transcription initiation factor RRN3
MEQRVSKKSSIKIELKKAKEDEEFNLKLLLESRINGENKLEYDFFLANLKQKQSDRQLILSVLDQIKHLTYLLDPNYFESCLINVFFSEIKWHVHYSNDEIVLNKLSEFLIDLNSAYGNYMHKCLTMLIKLFTIMNVAETENQVNCDAMHSLAHNVIAHLVKIAPSCKIHLVKLFESLYPYMTKDSFVQESFIKNLLIVADKFKEIRLSLLEICVQKALKIDVNSQREQIIEAEQQQEQSEIKREDANVPMKHALADRLDIKMEHLFKFVEHNCQNRDTNEFDWDGCKSMYKDLLFIFDKYVLCTYGSSHVQFLMFHICSKKNLLSEGFLDYLWKKFTSTKSCAITRQICSYYIGSMLARAKYVSIKTCIATMHLMIKWIHNYMEKTTHISYFDVHRTYYALCQTVFYVTIFRNRQLFQQGNNDYLNLVKSWRFNEIVSCKLNPLRYCLPTIRQKFARITYLNQIAYCYSIIDANNRITLPISGENSNEVRMFFSSKSELQAKSKENTSTTVNSSYFENPLDSFFPFDPYLLNRSKVFIEKFYVQFTDILDDEDEEMDSDDEDENEEDEEDDDEEDSNDEEQEQDAHLNKFHNEIQDSDFEHSIEECDTD